MSETLTNSPKQLQEIALPKKSLSEFEGDTNDLPSPAFDNAVIAAQESIGPEYYLNEDTFGEIMHDVGAGNWQNMHVGDALRAFDKAFGSYVMRMNKVPEEQIITLQSHQETPGLTDDSPAQINGINIPAEIAQNNELDSAAWAAAEQQRRLDYVFRDAEFHLNREFQIGDETYTVDSISYTGTDGNYETLEIKIKNTETGKVSEYLEPNEVNQMIASSEKSRDLIETEDTHASTPSEIEQVDENPELSQRIEKELEGFDQNAAFERAQFEAFLYEHPELLENTPESSEESTPQSPYAPISQSATIDAINDVDQPTAESIGQKKVDAINEFDKFVAGHPELEELRDEYMNDLNNYINNLTVSMTKEEEYTK